VFPFDVGCRSSNTRWTRRSSVRAQYQYFHKILRFCALNPMHNRQLLQQDINILGTIFCILLFCWHELFIVHYNRRRLKKTKNISVQTERYERATVWRRSWIHNYVQYSIRSWRSHEERPICNVSPLKLRSCEILKFHSVPTQNIGVFHMDLRTNMDYFPIQK
jgi:hypothetical protein